jgi:hypothetical protein
MELFLHSIEESENIDWLGLEEDEMENSIPKEKILSLKMTQSPFEELQKYLKSANFSLANHLQRLSLVVNVQHSKKKSSRKDRRRERREEEFKETTRGWNRPKYPQKFSKQQQHPQFSSSSDAGDSDSRQDRERLSIIVAKALADGTDTALLTALALLLFEIQSHSYKTLDGCGLYVGNLLAALFESSSSSSASSSEDFHSMDFDDNRSLTMPNPFEVFLNTPGANPAATSSVRSHSATQNSDTFNKTGDLVSLSESRDEISSQPGMHFGNTSDGGSTIGSNLADMGTDNQSVLEDEMNDDNMLAHALAMSMGETVPPPAPPIHPTSTSSGKGVGSSAFETMEAKSDWHEEKSLNDQIENLLQRLPVSPPFAALGPFCVKDFWHSFYSPNKEIVANSVPIQHVVFALIIAFFREQSTTSGNAPLELKAFQIPVAPNLENFVLFEFLLAQVKTMLVAHFKLGNNATKPLDAKETQKWFQHTYFLFWTLNAVTRVVNNVFKSLKDSEIDNIHQTNARSTEVLAAVRLIRDHLCDIIGISIPGFPVHHGGHGHFHLTNPTFANLNFLYYMPSLSGQISMLKEDKLFLNPQFHAVHLFHFVRLSAIDTLAVGLRLFVNDPLTRLEMIEKYLCDSPATNRLLTEEYISGFVLNGLFAQMTDKSDSSLQFSAISSVKSLKEHLETFLRHRLCSEALQSDPFLSELKNMSLRTPETPKKQLDLEPQTVNRMNIHYQSMLRLLFDRSLLLYSDNKDKIAEENNYSLSPLLNGEILLMRSLQILLFHKFFQESELNTRQTNPKQSDVYMEFTRNRCHPSLVLSQNLRVVNHVGPKNWSTVISDQGFPPESGIYEWSIKVDNCSKGHIFLGIVTSDFTIDKDAYVGVDRNGWGLIGTRSLWHNKSKIVADYGNGFGSGSVVTVVYDSHARTLSFRTSDAEWGTAFENLPKVALFPAVSLHENGDRITLLSVRNRRSAASGISDVQNDKTWSGIFSDYIPKLLVECDKNMSATLEEETTSSGLNPLLGSLFPSLLAFALSSKFAAIADAAILATVLPVLIPLSQKFVKYMNKHSSEAKQQSLFPEGEWKLSVFGPTNAITETITARLSRTLISESLRNNPVVDNIHEVINSYDDAALIKGQIVRSSSTLYVKGIQKYNRMELTESEDSVLNRHTFDLRMSFCGQYLNGLYFDVKNARVQRVEGTRTNGFSTTFNPCEGILMNLTFISLLCCSKLSTLLIYYQMPSEDLAVAIEDAVDPASSQEMLVQEPSENEMVVTEDVKKEDQPVEDTTDWFVSPLFSGGLRLTPELRDEMNESLQKLLGSCADVEEPDEGMMKTSCSSSSSQMILSEYQRNWLSSTLNDPTKSLGQETSSAKTDDGKEVTQIVEEYVLSHVGNSPIFKLGGPSMQYTRKLVLNTLVRHSGTMQICLATNDSLALNKHLYSERPVTVLLELFRALNRTMESIIRSKQENGTSYEILCRAVCLKCEFLEQFEIGEVSRLIFQDLQMTEKSNLLSHKWFLESWPRHADCTRIINELVDFLISPTVKIANLKAKLLKRNSCCLLRTTGYRSLQLFLDIFTQEQEKNTRKTAFLSAIMYYLTRWSDLPANGKLLTKQRTQKLSYDQDLECSTHYYLSQLQSAFEQTFSAITQIMVRSTWSKQYNLLSACLTSWNILIGPNEHMFLNQLNLFRVLQTVLDEIRTSLTNLMHLSVENEPDLKKVLDGFTNDLRMVSQVALSTVYSLATQIAVTSEVICETNISIRKALSGPDTFSKSLFDLVFSELFTAVKPLAMLKAQRTESPDLDKKNPNNKRSLLFHHKRHHDRHSHEFSNSEDFDLMEGEDYVYKILRLLRFVADSKICQKVLITPKWLSLFFFIVGLGSIEIQRRVFRLLQRLLLVTEPKSLIAYVPNLLDSPPDTSLFDTLFDDDDIMQFIEAADESSGSNNTTSHHILLFLLNCVQLSVPSSSGSRRSHFNKSLADCLSAEALLLLRVLVGIPKWRSIIYDCLHSELSNITIVDEEDADTARLSSILSLFGGSFEKKRLGGFVLIKPFALLGTADNFATKVAAASHSTGMLVGISSSSSMAEIVLMERTSKASNSRLNDAEELSVSHSLNIINALPIRSVRLPLADILPTADVPFIPSLISKQLFTFFSNYMGSTTLPFLKSENSVKSLFLHHCSVFRAIANCLQNENNVTSFMSEHLEVFQQLLDLSAEVTHEFALSGLESYAEKLYLACLETNSPTPSSKTDLSQSLDDVPLSTRSSTSTASLASRPPRDPQQQLQQQQQQLQQQQLSQSETTIHSPLRELASILSPYGRGRQVDTAAQQAALNQMLEIGLPREWCEFALKRCHYNVEMAINLCLENGSEMNQLIAQEALAEANRSAREPAVRRSGLSAAAAAATSEREGGTATAANNSHALVRQLLEMGFPPSWCARAMESTQNNLDAALGWILTHDEELLSKQESTDKSERESPEPMNTEAPVGEEEEEDAADWIDPLVAISGTCQWKKDLICHMSNANSGFPSVGCRRFPAKTGKWYYEATVITAGCCQIGWSNSGFMGHADNGQGVGDDAFSWAFDGWRTYIWHETCAEWGAKWAPGDVVGCALDLDNGKMYFYLNGFGEELGMGLAFDGIAERFAGLYPSASFNREEKIQFNFGGKPFKHPAPEGFQPFMNHVLEVNSSNSVKDVVEDSFEEASLEVTTTSQKRFFPHDDVKAPSQESMTFFNTKSEIESSSQLTDPQKLFRHVCILYARLIVLRCLKTKGKAVVSSKISFDKVIEEDNGKTLLKLFKLVSVYTSRTKAYLYAMSILPPTCPVPQNLGPIYCVGGFPFLAAMRTSFSSLIHGALHDQKNKGTLFIDAIVEEIKNNLHLASSREFSGKWNMETSIPFIMRSPSVSEAECLAQPSLHLALWLTSGISFVLRSSVKEGDGSPGSADLIASMLHHWTGLLKAPVLSVKILGMKMSSYLMQELLYFSPEKVVLSKGVQELLEISATRIRNQANLLLSSEHGSHFSSDFLQSILELNCSFENILYLMGNDHQQSETIESFKQSPMLEDSETVSDPFFNWEAISGRNLVDHDGWQTFTGTVKVNAVILPHQSIANPLVKPLERQNFPPALLPGCKVMKQLKNPNAANSESGSSESGGGSVKTAPPPASGASTTEGRIDSLLRLRMMLEGGLERERASEKAKQEAESDSNNSVSNHNYRIGTVESIANWPNDTVPGTARVIKWDDNGETETVRWGAEGEFDVVHVAVKGNNNRIATKYPNPSTCWQKLQTKFGAENSFSLVFRIRHYNLQKILEMRNNFTCLLEWPDFNAVVQCSGRVNELGELLVTEESLLSGPQHSGWESRFGSSAWQKGTTIRLRMEQPDHSAVGVSDPSKGAVLVGTYSNTIKIYRQSFLMSGSIELQQAQLFTFDDRFRASTVALSIDKLSVSKSSSSGQGCCLGSVGFSTGIHFWEFKIEQAEVGSVFLGIIEKTPDLKMNRLSRWSGNGFINNRTTFRTSSTNFAERVQVYGDRFHSGDVVGVVLDLNRGALSFFLDGIKYGEHLLTDLGDAFENLSQHGSVRPRTYFPIVGLSKALDRVTLTPRWFSVVGTDPREQYSLYSRVYHLFSTWNLDRSTAVPLEQHLWIYREAWRHYNLWKKGCFFRTRTRCKVSNLLITLNTSIQECVRSSIKLGLSRPLLAGDRIVFSKSSGRRLDVKEEAVILGSLHGLLWFKMDSHASSGGNGADSAWSVVPSDVEGLQLIKRRTADDLYLQLCDGILLPRTSAFSGGFLTVFHESGAVMRDGLEIDTSDIIATIPAQTRLYALERRVNASNINRFLVFYNGNIGWISERMRGGSEELMIQVQFNTASNLDITSETEAIQAQIRKEIFQRPDILEMMDQVKVQTVEEAMQLWQEKAEEVISSYLTTHQLSRDKLPSLLLFWQEQDQQQQQQQEGNNSKISFEEFVALSSTTDGKQPWSVECDMQLVELISRTSHQLSLDPLNLSIAGFIEAVDSQRNNANANAVPLETIPMERLIARAAILRIANILFSYTLSFIPLKLPEENEIKAYLGHDCLYELLSVIPETEFKESNGLNSELTEQSLTLYSTDKIWSPPCFARRVRSLKRLLFSHVKLTFWESIINDTTTITALPQDEYEDPKEIKLIKINRIAAQIPRLSNMKNPMERMKQSVFGQLHKELRAWSNASFRRSYIGQGHGGQKRAFKVKFIGEGVNDYGGPYRAVFEQIVDELRVDTLSSASSKISERCLLPLLLPCPNRVISAGANQDKYILSTGNLASPMIQELMIFLGKLIGMAVRHHLSMALDLSTFVWRPLIRLPISLAHLETIDSISYKTLTDMIELGTQLENSDNNSENKNNNNNNKNSNSSKQSDESNNNNDGSNNKQQPDEWMDITFMTYLADGTRVPLTANGENVPVNLENFRDFIQLTERARLTESIVLYKAFREGLMNILPSELFPLFTVNELETLICGSTQVDIDLIKNSAEYEDLDPNSPLVSQFWDTLNEFSDEEKTLFLR